MVVTGPSVGVLVAAGTLVELGIDAVEPTVGLGEGDTAVADGAGFTVAAGSIVAVALG